MWRDIHRRQLGIHKQISIRDITSATSYLCQNSKTCEPKETLSRQEDVGNLLDVDVPVLSILLAATSLITSLSVADHSGEEAAVEIGQRRLEAARQTPAQRHEDVTSVLELANVSIPAIHQQIALNTETANYTGCMKISNGKRPQQ
jgi:hypothetical protein